jgi:hypothetical protein
MDFRRLRRRLAAEGWIVSLSHKGHYRFVPPDRSREIVVWSGTPSDWRSYRNAIGQLRRSGARI